MATPPAPRRLSRRAALRLIAIGAGSAALAACGGLPGLAPTATPIIFGEPEPAAPAEAPPAPTAPAATAAASPELRLAYWDPAAQPALDAFQRASPDIRVALQRGGGDDIQRDALRALASDDGAPDIVAIGREWLGAYLASGELLDLGAPPFDAAAVGGDMAPALWQAGQAEGRPLAIPWLCSPAGLIYRADVLEEAGLESDPAALQRQLARWDDYIDLGVALRQKREGTMLATDAIDLFWMVLSQSRQPLVLGGQALIAELGTRPAQLAARARAEQIDANLQQNATAFAEFRQGKIASIFAPAGAEQFITGQVPETVGAWRIIAPPEGAGNVGAVYLAIPRRARRKEEAWQLIRFLAASEEGQSSAVKAGAGIAPYRPAWRDPLYDQPSAAFGGQPALRLWADMVDQLPALSVSPYDRQARELIEVELFQVLFTQKDPELAMQAAEQALLRREQGLRA